MEVGLGVAVEPSEQPAQLVLLDLVGAAGKYEPELVEHDLDIRDLLDDVGDGCGGGGPGRRPFDLAEGLGQLGHFLDGHVNLSGLPIAVNGPQHNVAAFSFVHHLFPALLSACLRKAMRFFSSRSVSPGWRSRP